MIYSFFLNIDHNKKPPNRIFVLETSMKNNIYTKPYNWIWWLHYLRFWSIQRFYDFSNTKKHNTEAKYLIQRCNSFLVKWKHKKNDKTAQIYISVIIGWMRRSCTARVKWIFRSTTMPVLKHFTGFRCIHGASTINTLKFSLGFAWY